MLPRIGPKHTGYHFISRLKSAHFTSVLRTQGETCGADSIIHRRTENSAKISDIPQVCCGKRRSQQCARSPTSLRAIMMGVPLPACRSFAAPESRHRPRMPPWAWTAAVEPVNLRLSCQNLHSRPYSLLLPSALQEGRQETAPCRRRCPLQLPAPRYSSRSVPPRLRSVAEEWTPRLCPRKRLHLRALFQAWRHRFAPPLPLLSARWILRPVAGLTSHPDGNQLALPAPHPLSERPLARMGGVSAFSLREPA